MEPAVKPLGWDWRIGMAALASFPAREVVVGTLGIIYNQGTEAKEELESARDPGETKLGAALKDATWEGDPARKVFTIPTAHGLLCVMLSMCLDAGGNSPGNQKLALAGVYLRLHDRTGLHRRAGDVPGWHADRGVTDARYSNNRRRDHRGGRRDLSRSPVAKAVAEKGSRLCRLLRLRTFDESSK